MKITGIDHVQVAAPRGCEAAARAFYGELLGMAEMAKPPALAARGGVWFRVGAQQLHIGVEREFAPARKAHPAFAVDDLEALAAQLTASDVPVTWDDSIPDTRRFFIHDPWGNRVELVPAQA